MSNEDQPSLKLEDELSKPVEEPQQQKEEEKSKFKGRSLKRRKSLYQDFDEKQQLFRPEYRLNSKDESKTKMWELMDVYLPRDRLSIQKSIVNHIEYTLSTPRFDINEGYIFQGTALSVRDRLLEAWNDTQLFIKINNPKKIYYMSIEFLLGRLLQNALINLDLEKCYKDALMEMGVKIEDIYERENDPALGNGGLGRLAACFIESAATLDMPLMGYGIRYSNGLFKQNIENGFQTECEDTWLKYGEAWGIRKDDETQIIK